jgi:lysophospholipase L1-like esterase
MRGEGKSYRAAARTLEEATNLLDLVRVLHSREPPGKIDTAPLLAKAYALIDLVSREGPSTHEMFVRDLATRHLRMGTASRADLERYDRAIHDAASALRRAATRARDAASPAELARARRQRVRHRAVRLVAVLTGVLASFVVTETALRVRARSRPRLRDALARAARTAPPPVVGECNTQEFQAGLGDMVRPSTAPDVIYELKPNVDTCFVDARATTNDEGVRGTAHYVKPRPSDVYRILLLGDSVTFGQAVAYEDTFAARIQRALDHTADGRRIEVVNTAVPGYNTAMEVASYLATGRDYEAQCVVVVFCGNDLEVPHLMLPPEPAWRGSYLLGALHDLAAPPQGDAWYRVADGAVIMSVRPQDIDAVPREYRHMVGLAGYRRALTLLAESAHAVGATVVNFADYSELSWVAATEEFTEFQRTLGIVLPPFQYPKNPEYWVSFDDAHPNPAGHAELATRMLAGMKAVHACAPLTDP